MLKQKMKNLFLFIVAISFLIIGSPASAQTVNYRYCNTDGKPAACDIALAKLHTLPNPLKDHNLFDNGLNFVDGKLFAYPDFYVAEVDLDGDGFNEIIAKIPDFDELMTGYYCKPGGLCLHYILQDRNVDGQNPRLDRIKAIGPIFAYSIGLSTDEVVDGYRSLRVYQDSSWQNFDVFQYDKATDDYHNVTVPE